MGLCSCWDDGLPLRGALFAFPMVCREEIPKFDAIKTEVNPKDTTRAEAFEMWMSSPMPMVTLTKTFNVGNLVKTSKKLGVKFNALLCWCICSNMAATECKSPFLELLQKEICNIGR